MKGKTELHHIEEVQRVVQRERHISALTNGAKREREKIVQWLRAEAYRLSGMGMSAIALEIEEGKHLVK